jgi:hypothetical protein
MEHANEENQCKVCNILIYDTPFTCKYCNGMLCNRHKKGQEFCYARIQIERTQGVFAEPDSNSNGNHEVSSPRRIERTYRGKNELHFIEYR